MRKLLLALFLLGLTASFTAGFYLGQVAGYVPPIKGVTGAEEGQPAKVDFSLFWDAWRVVQEEYAGPEPLDFQAMVHGAIKGMVESLQDPYTTFMTPQNTKIFLEDVQGSFSGVGMEIGMRDKKLRVIAPLEGTPAERAGLRPGDHIVKIGPDTFTTDLTIDEAVSLIRGPEGTNVVLSILRDSWDEPREFDIQRAVINIPSLRWEIKEGVAYVKIFQFSEKLRSDFANMARSLPASADTMVIDVRNNPGGFLHSAVDIAGWFLERGSTVVIEDFGSGAPQKEHKARGNARFSSYKVVVLINEGTASASEILAGSLRDNRGILLVGEQSFGKGSVQEVKELKDGSSVKVTIAKWRTPKGDLIEGRGFIPDVVVEITDEDFDQDRDPQLDKAIELVNNL